MKRVKLLVFTIALVSFVGCQDKEKQSSANVDFIGTWNYKISYKNGKCDHLSAKGTIDITPLEENASKIGQVMRSGDKFDTDKDDKCILTKTVDTHNAFLGYDRIFTKKSYIEYLENFHTDNKALKSIKITDFTQDKIAVQEKFSHGIVLTFEYHR